MNLLSSYAEEFKIFIQRLYVHPQIKNVKGYFTSVFNSVLIINQNKYDTKEQLESDLIVHIENFKRIIIALENYPEWKAKAKEDVNKLLAYGNMKEHFPEFYEILVNYYI